MKICTKCKISKPFSEFSKRNDTKQGYVSHCKECVKEYRKQYDQKNPNMAKEYYKKTREYQLECKRKTYDADKKRKYNKKYYKENKEKIIKNEKEKWHSKKTEREKLLKLKMKARIEENTKKFIERSNLIHNNKYDYSLVKYTKAYSPVKIICPEHGIFEQKPYYHYTGHGCSTCGKKGFDFIKPAIMYYLKINNGECYKIGITNTSIEERFKSYELKIIECLHIWAFDNGLDAFRKEQEILNKYKQYKFDGHVDLQNGHSELFKIDVLGIDI